MRFQFVRSTARHCSAPQAQQMNFNSIKVQIVNSLTRPLFQLHALRTSIYINRNVFIRHSAAKQLDLG